MSSLRSVTNNIFSDVSAFGSAYNKLTLAAFATIFTWGFVQALKGTVLTPLITAYLIPSKASDVALNVRLRKNQTLRLAEFLAEFIQFCVFMAIIFLIWKVTRVAGSSTGKN